MATVQTLSDEMLIKYYLLIKKEMLGRGMNPQVVEDTGKAFI